MGDGETKQTEGTIFNIQRYSLHDGPGIRTTAFLKGCPLHCRWCHNPEGIHPEPEIIRTEQGTETVGRSMTAEAVARELARDRVFYEESGGGITLSGGEPLAQPDFAIEILRRCKADRLHTALDTSGFVDTEVLLAAAPFTDLFLYDLKHPDSGAHEAYTGGPNGRIIENLKVLCAGGCNVLVRYPVVPGFNDAPETVEQAGRILADCGIEQLQLLPYHALGGSKRSKLRRRMPFMSCSAPSAGQMLAIRDIIGRFPFQTTLEE
jgi:pyruvate formate lyase activating enzyme